MRLIQGLTLSGLGILVMTALATTASAAACNPNLDACKTVQAPPTSDSGCLEDSMPGIHEDRCTKVKPRGKKGAGNGSGSGNTASDGNQVTLYNVGTTKSGVSPDGGAPNNSAPSGGGTSPIGDDTPISGPTPIRGGGATKRGSGNSSSKTINKMVEIR